MKHSRSLLISFLLGITIPLSLLALTTDQIIQSVYDSANTALRANVVVGSSGGTVTGTGTSGSIAIWNGTTALTNYAGSSACGAGSFVTALSAAGAATCTAAGGTISGLTTGLIPQAASATSLENSSSYRISITNDTVTGTVTSQLVKLTTIGRGIVTAAAETSGILGICVSGCGNSGSAIVALMGAASCDFTNATTAGNYATVSATVAGECQDTGSTAFPAAGTVALGIITETGAAGVRSTFLATPDVASAAQGGGGGGSKNPAGAAGDVQYRCTGNAFCAETVFDYSATDNLLTVPALTYTAQLNITSIVAVSSSASVAATTRIESCTSGASAITRTLPAATGSGRVVDLVKIDSGAGTCIFGRTGDDTLNGATTRTLSAQYGGDTCIDIATDLWLCRGAGT